MSCITDLDEEDMMPSDHIVLHVRNLDGNELHFRINRRTRLGKLMNSYCNRQLMDLDYVLFLFRGHQIRAEETPDELEMEDEDEIDVLPRLGRRRNLRVEDQHEMNEFINLRVRNLDGNEVFFRINRSTPLRKLMNSYCDRNSIDFDSVYFLFRGRHIRAEETPYELEMEDGEEIDALPRLGGPRNLRV